jgi:thiol peroxidase
MVFIPDLFPESIGHLDARLLSHMPKRMEELTMKKLLFYPVVTFCFLFLLSGCAMTQADRIPIDTETSMPDGTVTLNGKKLSLIGTPLKVDTPLPATALIDAFSMKKVDLTMLKGKVLLLSLVPSLDTKVCEAQTHYLGEQGSRLPAEIARITISRDTPFAQKRFAEEAKLKGITYLSDYRDGSFGRSTGLLQEESMFLARAVILVDKDGIVRYIQVVPELTHLPDMEAAFNKANLLLISK